MTLQIKATEQYYVLFFGNVQIHHLKKKAFLKVYFFLSFLPLTDPKLKISRR